MLVRRAALSVALIGAVAGAGVASSVASASPPRPGHSTITGGTSKITLSKSARKSLASNGYTLSAIDPAKFDGKTLTSPIKNGTFTLVPESAKINASGGFKITHGSKSVSITDVKSATDGTSGKGSAVVSGHGRIAAIVTGTPKTIAPSGSSVTASGFSVTLAKPLIKVLDKKFKTTLFKSHANIGKGDAYFTYK